MRRLLALLPPLAALAAPLLLAAPGYATDSLSASATVSGATIAAQVSGTADDCSASGCSGQTVTIVIQPDPTPEAPALCVGAPGTVIAQQSLPATGGSFTLAGSISEGEATYAICGYLSMSRGGQSVPLAATTYGFVVTMAPQPCPSGTPQALTLSAPAKLARGQRGAVRIGAGTAGATVESVVVTVTAPGRSQPLRTYAFSGADLARLARSATKTLWAREARGPGPTVVEVSYQVVAATTCTMALSARIASVPGARPVVAFAGARVLFSARGGCGLTAAIPASVLVAGAGSQLRLSAANVCGRWRVRGRIPGVSVRARGYRSGEALTLSSSRGASGTFRVTVRLRGRVAKRGVLRAGAGGLRLS